MKANLKKKTAKRGRKKTTESKLAGVAVNQVIDAANLIKACGSIQQAQQALKVAEKVAKALEH